MKIKKFVGILIAMVLVMSMAGAVFAGSCQLDETGWWYLNDDGTYPAESWANDGNAWYYFDENGYMETGWILDGNTWYYLDADGTMFTGWLWDGAWYFLDGDGSMVTGWKWIENNWYYFYADGVMATGWFWDGYDWYFMNADGSLSLADETAEPVIEETPDYSYAVTSEKTVEYTVPEKAAAQNIVYSTTDIIASEKAEMLKRLMDNRPVQNTPVPGKIKPVTRPIDVNPGINTDVDTQEQPAVQDTQKTDNTAAEPVQNAPVPGKMKPATRPIDVNPGINTDTDTQDTGKNSAPSSTVPGYTTDNASAAASEEDHVHNWEPLTNTILHDAICEQVWVEDTPAHDEEYMVSEGGEPYIAAYRCYCGEEFGTYEEWEAHCNYYMLSDDQELLFQYVEHNGFAEVVATTEPVYDTFHVEATGHYESEVIEPAWTETIVIGEQCTECGATRRY